MNCLSLLKAFRVYRAYVSAISCTRSVGETRMEKSDPNENFADVCRLSTHIDQLVWESLMFAENPSKVRPASMSARWPSIPSRYCQRSATCIRTSLPIGMWSLRTSSSIARPDWSDSFWGVVLVAHSSLTLLSLLVFGEYASTNLCQTQCFFLFVPNHQNPWQKKGTYAKNKESLQKIRKYRLQQGFRVRVTSNSNIAPTIAQELRLETLKETREVCGKGQL